MLILYFRFDLLAELLQQAGNASSVVPQPFQNVNFQTFILCQIISFTAWACIFKVNTCAVWVYFILFVPKLLCNTFKYHFCLTFVKINEMLLSLQKRPLIGKHGYVKVCKVVYFEGLFPVRDLHIYLPVCVWWLAVNRV